MSRKLKWSQEVTESFASCSSHLGTFELAIRPYPELYFLLTMVTGPLALFILKRDNLFYQLVLFIHIKYLNKF